MSGSWWNKVRNFFSATDEYRVNGSSLVDSATRVTDVQQSISDVRRSVNSAPRRRNSRIELVILKAEDYPNENVMIRAIANALRDGKSVVANMVKCSYKRQRIVDFASGMVYMINGDTSYIEENIYLFSTNDFDVVFQKPTEDDDASDYNDYTEYRGTGYSSRG